jgi:hypothetical protein
MNSLQELNNYGNASTSYTDTRTPGITFDRFNVQNQTVTINQHDTHATRVGIEIVEVIAPAVCTPTYTVNVSSLTGATVSWATVPTGCTVTNPSTGVYTISGVNSRAIWNIVKNPTVTLAPTYVGTGSYSATITYNTTQTKTWTIALTVIDITNMDTADDFYFLGGVSGLITGNPVVIDNYPTTWNVTVTPSTPSLITSLTSAGSGGTSSFNATTKVLSISGTKTQVNSHLNSITYVIPSSTKQDFTLTYSADNVALSEGDTKVQQFYTTEYLSATRAASSYSLNTWSNITNGPLITDANYTGTGLYTMTVVPSDTAAVNSMGTSLAMEYYPRSSIGTIEITLKQALLSGSWTTASGYNYFAVLESDYNDVYVSAGVSAGKEVRGLGLPEGTTITSIGSSFLYNGTMYRQINVSNNFTLDLTGDQTLKVFAFSFNSGNPHLPRAITVEQYFTRIAYSNYSTTGANIGNVYIYKIDGNSVSTEAVLSPSGYPNQGIYPLKFGSIIKSNTNFDVLAVVAQGDNYAPSGGGTGNSQFENGSVYIFRRTGTTWTQELRAMSGNTDSNYDYHYVELSPAGNTFVTSTQSSPSVIANSRMDFYNYRGGYWYQDSRITFSEQREILGFSDDETYFFLASPYTAASGINGAGSIYVYKRTGNTWAQDTVIYPNTPILNGNFGGYGSRKMPDGTFAFGQSNGITEIYSLVGGTWTRTSTLNYSVPSSTYYMSSDANYYTGEDTVYELTATGYTKLVYVGDNSLVETADPNDYHTIISANGNVILQFNLVSPNGPKFYAYDVGDPNRISFNSTTKTLTMTENKTNLNEMIDAILLDPGTDYTDNFVLTYTVTTPNSNTDSRDQDINYTS